MVISFRNIMYLKLFNDFYQSPDYVKAEQISKPIFKLLYTTSSAAFFQRQTKLISSKTQK